MPRLDTKRALVNVVGAVFYVVCMFQWLWSLMPYLPGIMKLVDVPKSATPEPIIPAEHLVVVGPPSIGMVIFAAAITVLFIGISIYVFIKLPTMAGKAGQKLTKSAATHIAPVVSRHVKLSPKKQRRLTQRIVTYIKFAICLLPVLVATFSYVIDGEISYALTMFLAGVLAIIAVLILCLQLLLAKWLRINLDKVW